MLQAMFLLLLLSHFYDVPLCMLFLSMFMHCSFSFLVTCSASVSSIRVLVPYMKNPTTATYVLAPRDSCSGLVPNPYRKYSYTCSVPNTGPPPLGIHCKCVLELYNPNCLPPGYFFSDQLFSCASLQLMLCILFSALHRKKSIKMHLH
jgi:hypothetical protein